MDKMELNELLKKAGFSKKEFAVKFELSTSAVNNWGGSSNVPLWVQSWLTLYIENKECKELKEIIRENVCKEG